MPPHLRVRKVTLAPGASARVYIGYANAGDFIGVKGFAGCRASIGVRLVLPGDRVAIALKRRVGGASEVGGRVQCGALSISPITRTVNGWD